MKTKFCLLVMSMCFTLVMNAQTTKNYDVTSFSAISISNGLDVYLTQGNTHSVKVEASSKRFKDIIVENKGDKLKLKYEGSILNNESIKIYVTVKNLSSLAVAGGSDVSVKTDLKTEHFSVAVTGGSDLSFKKIDATKANIAITGGSDVTIEKLIADKLKIAITGGSDVSLSGECNNMNLTVTGGSDVEARGLKAQDCITTVTGGSDVTMHVNGDLTLVANGASDVTCHGNPTNVTKTVSKSSDVDIL